MKALKKRDYGKNQLRKGKKLRKFERAIQKIADIKMASYLHRTAQPFTLATFRSWGSSTGAGRIRLAVANISQTV